MNQSNSIGIDTKENIRFSLFSVYHPMLFVESTHWEIFKSNIIKSNRNFSKKFTHSNVNISANINRSTKKWKQRKTSFWSSKTKHFVEFFFPAFEYRQRLLWTDGCRSKMSFWWSSSSKPFVFPTNRFAFSISFLDWWRKEKRRKERRR